VIMITIAVRTRAQTEPQSEVASSSSTTTGAATGHERAVKGPPNTRRSRAPSAPGGAALRLEDALSRSLGGRAAA
jgi:hypothetical protein